MHNAFKKRLKARDMPTEFSLFTRDTISRIEGNPNVLGIIYFRKDFPELCTLPVDTAKTLTTMLLSLTSAIRRSVIDIDVTNVPIAYRMETNQSEISVVMDKQFTACVVHKDHFYESTVLKYDRTNIVKIAKYSTSNINNVQHLKALQ